MKFEFVTKKDFNPIVELGKIIGIEPENNILWLPENIGEGYIKMLHLEAGLKLTIHRHTLWEELIFKRSNSVKRNNLVTITFNTIDRPNVFILDTINGKKMNLSSIYFSSTDIGLETCFPPNKNIHSTIIIIHTGLLLKFLETHNNNTLIKSITSGNQSFWYDTNMTPEIQNILMQMEDAKGTKHFSNLFYKLKIQQLIYQLFVELLEKENRPHHSLKPLDIEKMYRIREMILSGLDTPPLLYTLARTTGMCETKMKLLFRQIFGKSIYNYYQVARMEEAARLLQDLSVGETAYKLGFISPSYFSHLFEKYHKIRPKKFRDSLYPKKLAEQETCQHP